jgi:hypothetical protein
VNSPYDIVLKERTDRADLFNALHDPDAIAVYWLSHAAPVGFSTSPGLASNQKLLDISGGDVKSLFNNVSPTLKWVAVISCDSEQILETLVPAASPQVHGFINLIDARAGLRLALKEGDSVLGMGGTFDSCIPKSGRKVTIERIMAIDSRLPVSYVFPAITVQYQGRDVSAFPAVSIVDLKKAGGSIIESREMWISMPLDFDFNTSSASLVMQSGLDSRDVDSSTYTLGDFKVKGSWEGASWALYAYPGTSTPLGVTANEYLYNGSMNLSAYDPSGDVICGQGSGAVYNQPLGVGWK